MFLCHALQSIERTHPKLGDEAFALQQYIRSQLQGAFTLENWQERNGFPGRDWHQCRADRIAWIDWLLAEKS
jgi:hypothetical protein